jgi:hypothetical protein
MTEPVSAEERLAALVSELEDGLVSRGEAADIIRAVLKRVSVPTESGAPDPEIKRLIAPLHQSTNCAVFYAGRENTCPACTILSRLASQPVYVPELAVLLEAEIAVMAPWMDKTEQRRWAERLSHLFIEKDPLFRP